MNSLKNFMKRAISIVFLLTFVLALFAGCEEIQKPKETTVESPVKLWWAYNTENLMQDMEYPELMAQRNQTLRMQCIRGDVESVQLIMTPTVDVRDRKSVV